MGADIIINWYLISMPIIYGLAEGLASRKAESLAGTKIILDHFGFYHVVMFALFLLWNGHFGDILFAPLTIVISDRCFFFTSHKILGPDSWVNWKYGGFNMPLLGWIPMVYLYLIVLYFSIKAGCLIGDLL